MIIRFLTLKGFDVGMGLGGERGQLELDCYLGDAMHVKWCRMVEEGQWGKGMSAMVMLE